MGKAPRSRTLAKRQPLSRERILKMALALADESGLESVSMRQVAQGLGVEAMSLYKHVASKEDLLAGLVELIASEWPVPSPDTEWKRALRERAFSVRKNLLLHPWAANLVESRSSTGPALLHHHNATIGILRRSGFSVELAFNTVVALNSHIYGFVLQEQAWFNPKEQPESHQPGPAANLSADYPYIYEMVELVLTKNSGEGTRYFADFEFALNLFLDGLEKTLRNKN